MDEPVIIVIGAGASGIACATKLLEYGFKKVTILEAEDRIGGRIHTIPFGNNVIDLGAQWCHGEKDNVVYELAHSQNLLDSTGDIYDNYECIRSNGEVVSENITKRLKNIVDNSMVTRQMELHDGNGSLGSYLTNKFNQELQKPENIDIDRRIAMEFLENHKRFESSVEASDDLNDVSGTGYLEYWECEGDLLLNWKDKGYLEFLRLLMKSKELKVEHGTLQNRILFERKVSKITWNRNDNCVNVQCTNGDSFLADHVILTVSLGVLKAKHLDLFEPKLPIFKQRPIDGLAFGTVNKIFIEFPEKFWPDSWTGLSFLWRDEDLRDIRGTSREWLEDVFGFYCINYQPKVLGGWIVGANGRRMETLPQDEVKAGCMYLLRRFLKKWSIPDPVNFKATSWHSNTNFYGSYSYRSMHTDFVSTGASELSQPLTVVTNASIKDDNVVTAQIGSDKPLVQFAGEATSKHYYSTVHGAVESGWREAKNLADFYNETKMRKLKL